VKKQLTKIILAGAMAAVLAVPMIADARGRGQGDGLGNGFGGVGFGAGGVSVGGPGVSSRQGPQDDSSVFVGAANIRGHSSGPGLDTGNKGSRLKDGTGAGAPAR
jgi:hypothetical protein